MRKKQKQATAVAVRGAVKDGFSNALARLGANTPNLLNSTEYVMTRMTRDFATLNAMYRDSWIVRRIVDIIPADMLKNWITITSGLSPELLKKIDIELRRTQLIKKIQEGMCWGRLYGGALGIMLIRGQGSPEQLAMPLRLEDMVPGDFAGFVTLDRWNGVSPSSELVDDITDAEYGLPEAYLVTDPIDGTMTRIHHSRCIRFVGNNLPFWEKQAELYWGASVIEAIFDELKKRDNVSWNIAQLTFMANLRVLKMQDLGTTLGATDPVSQAELYRTLTAQNWLASNMGIQIMDAADGLETHQYTFGGLADCYQQFIMDISGAAEIPVTKLFGRSPSGLNATGESDLQNYYDMIGEKQESLLRPILNKMLPPLMMSLFGAVPDDLDFDFNPVSEPTDKERSDLAKSGTDNVVAAVNAGLVSKRTALKELKQQSERTGVWTNITDEDIEKASDEIDDPGEMGMMPGMSPEGPESPPPRPGGGANGNAQAPKENAPQDNPGRDSGMALDGGKGSGNFNHGGRPGKVGGSSSEPKQMTTNSLAEALKKAREGLTGTPKHGSIISEQVHETALIQALPKKIKFTEDTRLKNKGFKIKAGETASVITGIAAGKKVKAVGMLKKRYPGADPDNWVKCSCNVNVTNKHGVTGQSEVHFYYHDAVGGIMYKFPSAWNIPEEG